MEDVLRIGSITRPHGVGGEVKVFPTTDDINRFRELKQVWMETEKKWISLTVMQVKFIKKLVVLKFKEYNSMNEVEALRGCGLYVTRENAVTCEPDEYFITDLIGLSAISETGESLGELVDVIQTGANDVYVIHDTAKKELLIPAIKSCIRNIDIANGSITIHVMPGLQ
jgi:16S rRNA processing protein RimM